MGDQVGCTLDDVLYYVPQGIFELVRRSTSAEHRCTLFADLCRINALYMIARAGSGHIGSSFSSLDVVSYLFLEELDQEHANSRGALYFSSKGHDAPGLYAVLTGLGHLPMELIHKLRQIDGLPGHPDVGTPGIVANTGSLGMGISKAKGMIQAHRAQGERRSVFVLTGDGELQEGQIWESLESAVRLDMGELVVIVDHNKLQSDTFVTSTSDLGDLRAKFASFGWHTSEVDGHNMFAFGKLMTSLKTVKDVPKVVIAHTIKGRGVSFMQHTALKGPNALYRYHSGAPDAASYRRAFVELCDRVAEDLQRLGVGPLFVERVAPPAAPKKTEPQRLIPAYTADLMELGARHQNLIVLDADLAVDTGVQPFKERHPERFIECGIAEMDMVSQAGGLALRGALPLCHSFACFLSARPNEQIYTNATERTKIIYVAALAGLLPAGPGHSHQAVRDISSLAAVPDLVMLQPCSPEEVALALRYCVETATTSTYLRLNSVPCELPFEMPTQDALVYGCGVSVRPGGDGVFIAYGPVMLTQAFLAAERLACLHGIELEVINLPWLNRVDGSWLAQVLRDRRWLFTLDDHYIAGGQGSFLCTTLLQADIPVHVRCFGVEGIPACGFNLDVLRYHGLDAESLCTAIEQRMSGRTIGRRMLADLGDTRSRHSLGAA